jgi:hypothetical protein
MDHAVLDVRGSVFGELNAVSHVLDGEGVSFGVISDKFKDDPNSGSGKLPVPVRVFGELAEVVKLRFSKGLSKEDTVHVVGSLAAYDRDIFLLADSVEFAS